MHEPGHVLCRPRFPIQEMWHVMRAHLTTAVRSRPTAIAAIRCSWQSHLATYWGVWMHGERSWRRHGWRRSPLHACRFISHDYTGVPDISAEMNQTTVYGGKQASRQSSGREKQPRERRGINPQAEDNVPSMSNISVCATHSMGTSGCAPGRAWCAFVWRVLFVSTCDANTATGMPQWPAAPSQACLHMYDQVEVSSLQLLCVSARASRVPSCSTEHRHAVA